MTDTTDAETTASPAGAFTLPGGTEEARPLPAAVADAETPPAGTAPVSASVAPGPHTLPAKTGHDTRPSGIGKHYWTIPRLPVPSGASPALKSFIAMAEAALQTAVDLLGRGTTFPPPRVDDLLTTKVYKSLGEGTASELYQKTLEAVESRQASLLTMDDKVLDVANVMSADKDRTLAAIKHLIADLVAALSRKTAAKLQPADEVSLMDTIAKTIEEVYKRVSKVAEDNLRMSGGGNGGHPGGGNGGNGGNPGGGGSGGQQQPGANGGGGGGDSGGSGIMQALMMIPMLGASLLPSALQLVEKMNDKNDQRDDRQHPDGPPPGAPGGPPPGAAAPNSPGVPPPGATAPGAPGVPQPGPGGDPAAAAQPAGATIPVAGTDSPPGAPPPPPPPPPPPRTGSA